MLPNKQIDVALVKEFYSNVYDPKDRSSTTCIVRGRIIQFDTETLKEFLGTPITIVEGEQLTTYAHYLHSHPNYKAIAAKLCTPGGRFQLNIEEAPWKILEGPHHPSLDLECAFLLQHRSFLSYIRH